MKIANRFRVTLPAALAAVLFGGSAIAAPKDEPIAEISTSLGDFAVRLDAQRAPITVANFIRYADEGFYERYEFFIVSLTASWFRAAVLHRISSKSAPPTQPLSMKPAAAF